MSIAFPYETSRRHNAYSAGINPKNAATGRSVSVHRRPRSLCSVAIAAIAIVWFAIRLESTAAEQGAPRSGFVAEFTAEEARLFEQKEADSRRITVFQANEIHSRFLDRCMERLPLGVTVHYAGALATETGCMGQRVLNGIGWPLEWNVQKSLVIFSFWISTRRMKDTLARCSIEGTDIFLNVSFVDGNRSVDAKLPELGGRSVREVLVAIEKPTADEAK